MQGRYDDFGLNIEFEDEPNGMFDSLLDANFEECPECDYDGALELKKAGYTCPECRTLVLPNS